MEYNLMMEPKFKIIRKKKFKVTLLKRFRKKHEIIKTSTRKEKKFKIILQVNKTIKQKI